MTDIDSVTAVSWQWRADDKWTPYDASTNLTLEKEYNKGTARIKVDDERFVDVSLTPAQIKKNFYCIDCEDKHLIGIQRRYDDEMRRRAVKRVAPTFFKGVTAVVLVSDDDRRNKIETIITTYKGSVKSSITKRTKVIIADGKDASEFEEEWEQAEKYGIPVVGEKWLVDCMKQAQYVDPDDEAYKVEPATNKKRKQPEESNDDENLEPAAKKAKTSDNDSSSQEYLKTGAKWMGVCNTGGRKYPFTLTVLSVNGSAFQGTIEWPTLNNAKTKVKGNVNASNVEFCEYEIIQGEDDVEVPANYKGQFDNSTSMKGSLNENDPEAAGTWTAKLVESNDEDAEDAQLFQASDVYKGVCYAEYPFEIHIETRKGNDITGKLVWTSLGCTTKFKGTIQDGGVLVFEETAIESVSPGGRPAVVPTKYEGSLVTDDNGIHMEGRYGSDTSKPIGNFKINFGQ